MMWLMLPCVCEIIMLESKSLPIFKLQSTVHVQINIQMRKTDVLLSVFACFLYVFPYAILHILAVSFLLYALIHTQWSPYSISIHQSTNSQICSICMLHRRQCIQWIFKVQTCNTNASNKSNDTNPLQCHWQSPSNSCMSEIVNGIQVLVLCLDGRHCL